MSQKIIPPGITFRQAVTSGYAGRFRARAYLDWLATLPCHHCGKPPPAGGRNDPSHLNGVRGQGTKSPDWFALPECRECHERYEANPSRQENDARIALVPYYLLQAIFEGHLQWR